MNSAKHILFLVPGFPKDENDFNCIPPLQEFLLKFKSAYTSAGISVIAFQYPYRNTQYLWNGINIFPMAGKNKVYMKPLVWLRAIKTAKNFNRENRVDVIHSLWLGECAMIGNLLAKKFNCEHICTLMGQDVKSNNRYLRSSNNSRIRIIALSQFGEKRFVKQMIKNGASGYLLKDADKDVLEAAIRKVNSGEKYFCERLSLSLVNLELKSENTKSLFPNLTSRELDVLNLICKEYSTQEIADKLFVSFHTVEGHRANLLDTIRSGL